MGAAPLPRCSRECGCDGVDQTGVVVGDDQLHSGEAPSDEGTEERQSAGPVLSGGHVDTEDLSVSFSVDTGGH
jgi:hypothetical protein